MNTNNHLCPALPDHEAIEAGRKDLGTLAGQIRAMLDANLMAGNKELFHDLLNELATHFRTQVAHEEAFLEQTHPNLLATQISAHIDYESRLTEILIGASTGQTDLCALRSLLDDLQITPGTANPG